MRGTVDRLGTPRPLGATLPALYLDDHYVQGICEVADRLLAPAFLVLDSYHAYLDPTTTPTDALDWLAGWLGLALGTDESPTRKRELVRAGAELLRWRGTATGVRDAVAAAFGVDVEVVEPGGASWSDRPSSTPELPTQVGVTVRVTATDPAHVDVARLDALVAAVTPAHVPHRVEIVGPDS